MWVEACTGTYTEEGAEVTDNYDDDVSVTISYSSTIDVDTVGTYIVTYSACDDYDNCATDMYRYVYVKDTTAPTIVLYGDDLVMKEAGEYEKNSGAYATDTCSPEKLYPCVYCEEDDTECSDNCVSFTAEVIAYEDFSESDIESEYWDAVYGCDADEMIYWCGESHAYGVAIKEWAVENQNLTYFGQSCGEFIITYHVEDVNGNGASETQSIWTVDTEDPDITVSSLNSPTVFTLDQIMGASLVVVGGIFVVGMFLRRRAMRMEYSQLPM